MAWPSTNSEVQDLFAKLLEKRFDRQPCCARILYECMRFLIGHCKVSAAEKFLSFGCVRTEHRLVSAYIAPIGAMSSALRRSLQRNWASLWNCEKQCTRTIDRLQVSLSERS